MTHQSHMALLEALGSSLDIRSVVNEAYPLLLRLVPADYGALGVSASGRAQDYEWLVANVPQAFFAVYPDLAAHDFVRMSVMKRPNRVLRDEEMLPRAEIEANVFYHRAHEVGMPIERAMAVMLHVDNRWQSGLSLYREGHRPFSERERENLQRLTPLVANTVRNCYLFGATKARGDALEGILAQMGDAVIVVAPPDAEVMRTDLAMALLDKWFASEERRVGRLPDPLLAELARARGISTLTGGTPTIWMRRANGGGLEVTILPLPRILGPNLWALVLHELPRAAPLPAMWSAKLTPREQDVVSRVMRGWSNGLIAEDLGCAEGTVKKHLQSVFDKLGVQNRTALVVSAAPVRR